MTFRVFCAIVLVALCGEVTAHERLPIYIELIESPAHHYQLRWKTPPSVPLFGVPTVSLPTSCRAQTPTAKFNGPDGLVRRVRYHCSGALAGQWLRIHFPALNPTLPTLIVFDAESGERHTEILAPERSSWRVPHTQRAEGVAGQYTWLGVEHIFLGVDHLLFLLCLLWIANTWRRTLITVTGFTLAHSLTLALSALDMVRLPIPPVEAAISLSVLFLATEITKGPRASLTWNYPIAVSSSFGLLHGFGFAATLSKIGLPQQHLLTGLLFFNVGVELGQILFVGGAMALFRIIQRLGAEQIARVQQVVSIRAVSGYTVGALAALWLIERGAWFRG